jgi:2-hydroxy-3-keto-5-methylthiopentenyl-1-phosphate phosphatase
MKGGGRQADVKHKYKGMISSDWNECLAPCGPFDPIAFTYPELEVELSGIFRQYTANQISLSEATRRIEGLLPKPIIEKEMDAYLDASFAAYRGVIDLIHWCTKHDILFMINTTGMQGYFQRAMPKGLLPEGIVVAANPMISYPGHKTEMYEVLEIEDKARNTEAVMRLYGIPAKKVILAGDSGGDGPHFAWGASVGAYRIGSMPKPSLERFCKAKGIEINARFGVAYSEGEKKEIEKEMAVDFLGLVPVIEAALVRTSGENRSNGFPPSRE